MSILTEAKSGATSRRGNLVLVEGRKFVGEKYLLMKTAFQRWLWLVTALPGGIVFGAEPGHGLPQNAVKIEHWGGFITNSMVFSWVVAIVLIIFARVATRNMKGIPGGAQNLLEWLVESLYDFLEKIIGPHLVKRTFWFLATIFIFILSANWFGLIPGVGTIGWGQQDFRGFRD